MPEKYVGAIVAMIYLDRSGRITQRRIRVNAVQGGLVHAYDLEKRAPRVFHTAHILAVSPDSRTA
ncbi:hypothetical protein GZH47_04290 [Paenibacillus rhizovicinus]|uniref:Uncharacterized protein n=1 Tax=Paenibacillus rhizovicinus TaxID=2704463 RepID=A0A6C0NVC5_9BACL|nr:hypothetical protein [Paenibacillus rhizovicinus]QHW30135.1 hypothetical protein GZH47_04290 [Paenibacillus rhizovicinus]